MEKNFSFWAWFRVSCVGAGLVTACGGGAITHRYVDTEVGVVDALGAPHDTEYVATAETEREQLRISVFERSLCDKLKMKVVQHVDQAVQGDKVVSSEPPTTIQRAAGVDGVVPCEEHWARNVWVGLRVGDQTFRLGAPSARGEVIANLSAELKQSLYGENAPQEAVVVVNGVDAGKVSLSGYASHETRINQLLDELRTILSKDEDKITKAEIARSYELYEQLDQLDSGNDARIAGLRKRFIEVVYQRKQREATENLKRNVAALNEAKGVLPALAAGSVPPYVVTAIKSGATSTDALLWARGEVALAVRQYPALCNGTFGWSRLGDGDYAPKARLAFSYLHYAYDDPFQTEVRALCARTQ
ncbi:MAG TPA: hypothetical protein VHC69_19785 [Polyangiaceae bacterium]|nr:hypothetical protein [Polyangiaceae bacterium]